MKKEEVKKEEVKKEEVKKEEEELLSTISCPWWEIGRFPRRKTGWLAPGQPAGVLRGGGGGVVEEKVIKTNDEVLKWYNELMETETSTEDKTKTSAIAFFGKEVEKINKRTILKKLTELKLEDKNIRLKTFRLIQKAKGGRGKNSAEPPESFNPDMDTNEKKQMFSTLCRNEINAHENYIKWGNKPFTLLEVTKKESSDSEHAKVKEVLKENSSNSTMRLVRERSSGPNIFDTEKVVLTERSDGTVKKSVITETIATVTTRQKRKSGKDVSGETQRKRTKTVDNVLNHINENNKENKAKMISKIIDDEGEDFAKKVKTNSKQLKQTESLTVTQTNSLQVGTRSSDYLWRKTRTAFINTIGFSPLASAKKVEQLKSDIMKVKKEDWDFVKKNLYKNKQGANKTKPTETAVLLVKDLPEYIVKMAESESDDLDITMEHLDVCFNADAGAGRFVAAFTFLNRKDGSIRLHPFLIYEGSDCRANLEMTLGEFTDSVREMEGKSVIINNVKVEIRQYGVFDLAAVNTIVGKQNHSSSFPCAWTDVSKDHLSSEKHKDKSHTLENCKSISFLTMKDYETNLTHHAVQTGNKQMAETGKQYGSVVANSLLPFKSMTRYIPPLMHLIMGETNNVLKELKNATIKADEETSDKDKDAHKVETQKRLVNMYDEQDNLEAEWSNINLAEMVVLNDLKRVKLLLQNNSEEAAKVAKENYNYKKKTNKKQQCDADLCLLFASDVENEWDAKFVCVNTCSIHIRCEGIALIAEDEEMPDNYECVKCKEGKGNKDWLENTLEKKSKELNTASANFSKRIISQKAEIELHENMETELSGPRQKQLKEAMISLGDVARYHGGDLQGKQVQKLLDNARDKAEYKLLDCIKDQKETHEKFKKAIKILADISDALKMPFEQFDNEDVQVITNLCTKWGEFWPNNFQHKNITPKGHITSIVLPKIVEELKTFYKFYKVEQKGEEIHAQLNDIDRKAWVIKDKGARLWALIYRYEMRNITNVDIINPVKRVFTNTRRTTKYL